MNRDEVAVIGRLKESVGRAMTRPPRRGTRSVAWLGFVSLTGGLLAGYMIGSDSQFRSWVAPALLIVAALCWSWVDVLPDRLDGMVPALRALGWGIFVAALLLAPIVLI